jgi:hypothetical protein
MLSICSTAKFGRQNLRFKISWSEFLGEVPLECQYSFFPGPLFAFQFLYFFICYEAHNLAVSYLYNWTSSYFQFKLYKKLTLQIMLRYYNILYLYFVKR